MSHDRRPEHMKMENIKRKKGSPFDPTFIQKELKLIISWYEKVTSVEYDGYGNIVIKGESIIRNNEDFLSKKSAQLARNLTGCVSEHFGLSAPIMNSDNIRKSAYTMQ